MQYIVRKLKSLVYLCFLVSANDEYGTCEFYFIIKAAPTRRHKKRHKTTKVLKVKAAIVTGANHV